MDTIEDIEDAEDIFNINSVLITLFSSIKSIANEKNIELIYEMNSTLPRNLRGDHETLLPMLTQMLTFVFEHSDREEIVLTLLAPEDFLYEEFISFKIQKTNIAKEKILIFLESNLNKHLEILDGKIIDDQENIADIHLSIPFKNIELGFRRHYRLPDRTIVGRKILLLCANDKTAHSLKEMFEYFLYKVTVGFDEFNSQGNDLRAYDVLIISEKIITEKIKQAITKTQESSPLKYVLFQDSDAEEDDDDNDDDTQTDSIHLIKPATQEKIFNLIISLFHDEDNGTQTDEITQPK